MKFEYSTRVYMIAVFSALASLLQLLEIFIILPIPFVKIGLANAIVLFFIARNEFLTAFCINIFRVFIGGFFSAKLFSLPFLFSLSGAALSFFVMLILFAVFRRTVSLLAISSAGAAAFNLAQFFLFTYFFDSTFGYNITVSLIILLSLLPGILTGVIAEILNRQDIEIIKKPR